MSFKSFVGRAVRGVYLRLPLPWKWRLSIKSAIFVVFAPLLRHTNSYHRWRWQHQPPGAVPLLPGPLLEQMHAAQATNRQDPRDVWIRDVLALARTPRSAHYVAEPARTPPSAVRAKAIAFYLPQFHPVPENDAWWGRGFTEWTNVSKAVPQFVGHEQPKLPGELGFYDLRLPEIMRRQAELARLHGLYGFCFHYYWFSGRRLLERPLDLYLASDIDFPFCLCWANENWSRRWDGRDSDVLIAQTYGPEYDVEFIRDLIPYLRDRRYIRLDGRPLVIVYRPSLLPDCRRTLEVWRKACRDAGVGEIFLAMVQFDVEDPRHYGFDAALEFPPHKLARDMPAINDSLQIVNPDYAGMVLDYRQLVERAVNWPLPDYALFRGLSPGWDNEARKPGRGYTFAHATPSHYGKWLGAAVRYAERHPVADERVVFINAWNEWAEGAYLEPDSRHGYAYLAETRRVLEARQGIVLVVHDAHPHGAQYLALHLARELRDGLGFDVHIVLLAPGPLRDRFTEVGQVHECYQQTAENVAHLLADLKEAGASVVFANTVVTGHLVPEFRRAGFDVISLVHELPGLIRDYGLEPRVNAIVEASSLVVVASPVVEQGLRSIAAADRISAPLRCLPQGLFTRSRYRAAPIEHARRRLRERLGLPPSATIFLTVGYADYRKGVDLAAAIACIVCTQPGAHFVWVGHRDERLAGEVEQLLARNGIADRFHFVGLDFDTDDFYAGSDAYALTSREDPFPSVVLEALSVGTPVVAFEGTGGGAALIAEHLGTAVPAFDLHAFAARLQSLVFGTAERDRCAAAGRQLIDRHFSFRRYVMDMLAHTRLRKPRVSVVVPNFNYRRFLEARLRSIASQTLPPYEIIVLDDASTDGSMEELLRLQPLLSPELRIIKNHSNSGSVFRQWCAGVREAQGDYIWIAEADDLCSPDFLERVVTRLEASPSAVFGFCQSGQIGPDGEQLAPDYHDYTDELSQTRWRSRYQATGADEVDAALAVKNTIPNVSAVVFRREPLRTVLERHIEEIATFRIAGDWVVYLRLLQLGGIVFESRTCNFHRRHPAGVTLASSAVQHFAEVARAQQLAAALFPVSDATKGKAAAYLRRLRRQFCLDPEEIPCK